MVINKYKRELTNDMIDNGLTIEDVMNLFEVEDNRMRESIVNIIPYSEHIRMKAPIGGYVDVYDVLAGFSKYCYNPCIQHALKKMLCTGIRGHKNKEEDLYDVIKSLSRAIDVEKLIG